MNHHFSLCWDPRPWRRPLPHRSPLVALSIICLLFLVASFILAGEGASVCTGYYGSCMLDLNGQGVCWGMADPGTPMPNAPDISPMRLVHVTCAWTFAVGLMSNGSVLAWGPYIGAAQPRMDVTFEAISASNYFAEWCGIVSDTKGIQCYVSGYSAYPPVVIPFVYPDLKFFDIHSGRYFHCALFHSPSHPDNLSLYPFNASYPLAYNNMGDNRLADNQTYVISWANYSKTGVFCFLNPQVDITNAVFNLPLLSPASTADRPAEIVQLQTSFYFVTVLYADGQAYSAALNVLQPVWTQPVAARPVIYISAGVDHNCLILAENDQVYCWGVNTFLQATPPDGGFSQLACAYYHTCGVKTDGSVACWGSNQFGNRLPPSLYFQTLAAGSAHVCGIVRSDEIILAHPNKNVLCFGENIVGQSTPPELMFDFVNAQWSFTCGIESMNNLVHCWGDPDAGQTLVPANLTGSFVSLGFRHACAVTLKGNIRCWGDNESKRAPSLVRPKSPYSPPSPFVKVVSGDYHNCFLQANGNWTCMGDNSLDEGSTPAGMTCVDICSHGSYTCCLRSDVTIDNNFCIGDTNNPVVSQLRTFGVFFDRISCGEAHACAITQDTNQVLCWGYGEFGQLIPPDNTNFTSVTLGASFTCGVSDQNMPLCWGKGAAVTSLPYAFADVAPQYYHRDNNGFDTPCQAGRYSTGLAGGSRICSGACDAGRYGNSSFSSTSDCTGPCPVGHYCPSQTHEPIPCPSQTYSPYESATTCLPCFQIVTKNGSGCGAIDCPAGRYSATAISCLDCPVGTFSGANEKVCTPCPQYTYNTDPGQRFCKDCPAGMWSHVSESCVICSPGLFANLDTSTCQSCVGIDGVTCVGGIATVEAGFWPFTSNTSSSIFTSVCPLSRCVGGKMFNGTYSMCDVNRISDPSNVLCGKCYSGFNEWNSRCAVCDGTNVPILVAVALLTFAYVCFLHQVSQVVSGGTQVAVYFIQAAMIQTSPISGQYSQLVSWIAALNFNSESAGSSCFLELTPMQNFVLPAYLPLLFTAELALLLFFHYIYFAIWRAYRKHKGIAPPPVFSMYVNLDPNKFNFHPYVRTITSLFLNFSYEQVSSVTTAYLTCVNVNGRNVVFKQPSIDCDDSYYSSFVPLVWVVICVYVIGCPVVLFCFLYGYRKKIWVLEPLFTSKFGTLFDPYRSTRYLWAWIIMMRRICLIAIQTFLYYDYAYRYMSFTVFNLACLVIQMYYVPFKQRYDNHMEMYSLIILTVLSVLFLSVKPPIPETTVLTAASITVLSAALGVLWLVYGKAQVLYAQIFHKPIPVQPAQKKSFRGERRNSQMYTPEDESYTSFERPMVTDTASSPSNQPLMQSTFRSNAQSTVQPTLMKQPSVRFNLVRGAEMRPITPTSQFTIPPREEARSVALHPAAVQVEVPEVPFSPQPPAEASPEPGAVVTARSMPRVLPSSPSSPHPSPIPRTQTSPPLQVRSSTPASASPLPFSPSTPAPSIDLAATPPPTFKSLLANLRTNLAASPKGRQVSSSSTTQDHL